MESIDKGWIINGDCLEEMKQIGDGCIDLVVTSPPYDNLRTYNDSCNWNFDVFKSIADQLARVLKDGGAIVWIVNDATQNGSETGTSFKQALYFKEIGLNLHDTMIYAKENPLPLTHRRYEQCFEYMFVFTKGKLRTFNPLMVECKNKGRVCKTRSFYQTPNSENPTLAHNNAPTKDFKQKNNIWFVSTTCDYKGHPAQFPMQLAHDHILSWSNENDLVLDPFFGSGTTAIACENTNRQWIGIEKDETYYNLACERIRKHVAEKVTE